MACDEYQGVAGGDMTGLQMLSVLLLSAVIAAAPLGAAEPVRQKQGAGITVFSIVPAQGEPGTRVTITGSGIAGGVLIQLGGNEVSARVVGNRHIEFFVPQVPPGQYALAVRGDDGVSRSYSFMVLPLRPVVLQLEPDQVSSCVRGDEREVTVRGRNFLETSQLLFDGAIIRSRYQSAEAISFTVPPVTGGLHQISIKNGDAGSTPLGLSVVTTPVIRNVFIGTDRVSSYDLVVEGSNFHQNSSIFVDGTRVGGTGGVQEERLIYQDCTRVIYQRRPYSSTPKELRIQVVNPGGEASQTVSVSAP